MLCCIFPEKIKNIKMVQAGGLEPPAYFLGGSRSILMSYACTVFCLICFMLKVKAFLFMVQ